MVVVVEVLVVAVCHLSSLSSHQFVGICETRGTGKEEEKEYSIDIRGTEKIRKIKETK